MAQKRLSKNKLDTFKPQNTSMDYPHSFTNIEKLNALWLELEFHRGELLTFVELVDPTSSCRKGQCFLREGVNFSIELFEDVIA